jgi:Putative addiction module component
MAQQDFDTIIQTLPRLTPGEKLALIERLAHSLQAPRAVDQVSAVQQREALRRLRYTLATLPVRNPEDGFSNRDHDRLLYGDP